MFWTVQAGFAQSVEDSYATCTADANTEVCDHASCNQSGIGQSFTASFSGNLTSVDFCGAKFGSPTGNVTAELYTHSGTYGTSSVGTGAALATSDTIDVSTLSTSASTITFTFSGGNQYALVSGTRYVIAFRYTGGALGTSVKIQFDSSSPGHGGNGSQYFGSWAAQSGWDVIFSVSALAGGGGGGGTTRLKIIRRPQ